MQYTRKPTLVKGIFEELFSEWGFSLFSQVNGAEISAVCGLSIFNKFFDGYSRKQALRRLIENHTKLISFKKFRFLLAEVKA